MENSESTPRPRRSQSEGRRPGDSDALSTAAHRPFRGIKQLKIFPLHLIQILWTLAKVSRGGHEQVHVEECGGSIWQMDRINVRSQMQDRLQRRERPEDGQKGKKRFTNVAS